jgi:hypothetical protein
MQALLDPVIVCLHDTRFLTEEQKIHGILLLLRSTRLSALDVVTKILGDRPEYKSWKDGLFKGRAFEFFFEAMDRDRRGSRLMDGLVRTKGLSVTLKVVEREMNEVKKLLKMSMKEVTPEFLYAFDLEQDITRVFTETTPTLQKILHSATQSPRAVRENSRDTAPVSCKALIIPRVAPNATIRLQVSLGLRYQSYTVNGAKNSLSLLGFSSTLVAFLAKSPICSQDAACVPAMMHYEGVGKFLPMG